MLKRLALVTLLARAGPPRRRSGRPERRRPAAGQRAPAGSPPGRPGRPAAARPAPGAAPAAAQDQQPPAQPTFRAGINFVRVDVIVTDKKGKPVLDLKPEDFTVTEDGKPQAIESFKLIKVDRSQGHDAAARDSHELRRGVGSAARRRAAVRVLPRRLSRAPRRVDVCARSRSCASCRTSCSPPTWSALMYPLTPLSDVVMARNHEALARAVEQFDGRKYDYTPRNQFEEKYANYPGRSSSSGCATRCRCRRCDRS